MPTAKDAGSREAVTYVRPGLVPLGHAEGFAELVQSGRANVDGPGRMLKSKMEMASW